MVYLRDISAILGVSISTVSKALKGYPDISEETRRIVIRTAEDIGYKGGGDRDRRAHDWSNLEPGMTDRSKFCKSCCETDQIDSIGLNIGNTGWNTGDTGWNTGETGQDASDFRRHSGAIGVFAPDMGKLLESACNREMLCAMAAESVLHNCDLVIFGADKMNYKAEIASAEGLYGICLLIEKEDPSREVFLNQIECGIPLVIIETDADSSRYVAGSLYMEAGQCAAGSPCAVGSPCAAESPCATGSPDEIGRAAVRRLLETPVP